MRSPERFPISATAARVLRCARTRDRLGRVAIALLAGLWMSSSAALGAGRGDGLGETIRQGAEAGALGSSVSSVSSGAAGAAGAERAIVRADRLWQARADELDGRLAIAGRTEQAWAAYRDAIDESDSLAFTLPARWKALRTAHYLSEFTDAPTEVGDRAIELATQLAEASLEEITRPANVSHLGELSDTALEGWLATSGLEPHDVAELHFWSAIVWGARAQRVGLLTIVRQGIATRMADHARLVTCLAPTIERGGAYRLLSRLNADLPRVPFVSGWVDRAKALPQAERALEIDPDDPGNQLILALALRDVMPPPNERIASLLGAVASLEPRAGLRAEDLAIREQARTLLEE